MAAVLLAVCDRLFLFILARVFQTSKWQAYLFIYLRFYLFINLFTELSHDAGLRYVNQLEMDLLSLKHRLQYASPERVNRHTNCVCAEMEKHFMEMAAGAYKSVRRYDWTMNSFEQFKQELTQTNQVIKDSMELLQNVRWLCVH